MSKVHDKLSACAEHGGAITITMEEARELLTQLRTVLRRTEKLVIDGEEREFSLPTAIGLTLNDYQQASLRTMQYDIKDPILFCSTMLSSEVGEVQGLIQKHFWQGHPLNHEKVKEEAGDVLWAQSGLMWLLGQQLGDVAVSNVRKLMKRYPDGFTSVRSIGRAD